TKIVAIDSWVRFSRKHLVITRIRELQSVRNSRFAFLIKISEDLSMVRNDAPEKRHQHLPPLLLVLAPKFAPNLLGIIYMTVFLVEKISISTMKNLLPAQAIGDDEHHILIAGWYLSRRGNDRQKEEEVPDEMPRVTCVGFHVSPRTCSRDWRE